MTVRPRGGERTPKASQPHAATRSLNLLYSPPAAIVVFVLLVNPNRIIASIYLLLLVGFGVVATMMFLEARAEYDRLRQILAANQQRLARTQAQLDEQEKTLYRLQHDPAYVQKVIRQQLGWVRKDEFIFRFEN